MEMINVPGAAAAIGPYSHCVKTGDLLFASGQIPVDASGNIVGKSIAEQAPQALANVETILKGVGLGKKNIVKVTVYLTNLDDFATFNTLYGDFLGDHRPARTTVEISRLPKGALIEVDVIASFK
ncbi:MAG: Rid family detoxifying hydrolase [Deltaproteobacteria bacterium]|jgi:2-iminobutanoate/2-iminopropanoate deaminase|nr:Rid family detoxifying hydrolase [Deltaproteobacteria bacterium]